MAAQLTSVRVVWKSASMRPGEQCQMMDGQPMMLVLCADNLVFPDSVSYILIGILMLANCKAHMYDSKFSRYNYTVKPP